MNCDFDSGLRNSNQGIAASEADVGQPAQSENGRTNTASLNRYVAATGFAA